MQKFFTSLTAVATLTLAAVPALGLLQAAHAAQPTATIFIGDLDLSDGAQAAEFRARVDAKAEALCRQIAGRSSGSTLRQGECVNQFRVDVRRQLSPAQRDALSRSTLNAPVQMAAR